MTQGVPDRPPGATSHRTAGGFTLVEMLAAVTTVSLVLSSVAVTISSLHKVNRKLRDDFPAAAGLSRLAARFRADVHAARRAIPIVDRKSSGLQLELPDRSVIEYSDASGRVQRIESRDGAIARRDSFQLPRGSRCGWTFSAESGALVEMSVDRPSGPTVDAAVVRSVSKFLACVGTDRTGDSPE